jgi:osmotically-inducible protein OsmY
VNEDLKLQQHVIDELEFSPEVESSHIGVTVRDGVVSLFGHVESLSEKQAAERIAREVRGVRAVAQQLQVELAGDRKTSDDEIAARALKLLQWDAVLGKKSIGVTVSQGVITLSGEVDWHYQRREAEADVRRLGGVRDVINRIHLRPSPKVAEVSGRIHSAFKRAADLDAGGITVEALENGTVRLAGTVRTLGEQLRAENAAWATPGVTAVENHIKVDAGRH